MGEIDNNKMLKLLKWVIKIDKDKVENSVKSQLEKFPKLSKKEHAEKLFSKTRWKTILSGVSTSMFSNPFISLPSSMVDSAYILKSEVEAASKIALIYDPKFVHDEDSMWELLVPILGINKVSSVAKTLAITAGKHQAKKMIKKTLTKQTLKAFQKAVLKAFGKKVTQKAVITKTIPIVGAIIGGGWNMAEITIVKKRVIKYFEDIYANNK